MKKTHFILYILLFFSVVINAQNDKGKEKIRALKIAYLTEKLDLTSNEAEKFWPLFNQYYKERRELFQFEKKELKEKIKDDYKLSNSEAKDILNKINDLRDKRHKNKNVYNKELLKILPAKKVLILEATEREFNKKLMHKLKSKTEE